MNTELLSSRAHGTAEVAAVWLVAVLMVVSGAVHLHLWDIAYRHVTTLGPLFLVQAVAAIVLAVGFALTRLMVLGLASALLMVGTIVGFILAATVGIFGFTLPTVTGWAYLALVTEALSTAILAVLLARQVRGASAPRMARPAG